MKNRVLGLALAILAFPAHAAAKASVDMADVLTKFAGRDSRAFRPAGARGRGRTSHRTVSMDKRDARKRRDVLRARGHHRQAVR